MRAGVTEAQNEGNRLNRLFYRVKKLFVHVGFTCYLTSKEGCAATCALAGGSVKFTSALATTRGRVTEAKNSGNPEEPVFWRAGHEVIYPDFA